MKQYTIYFEIFGKKMKTTLSAFDEEQAVRLLKEKIVFHKIEQTPDKTKSDEFVNEFEKIFKGFK
jgi:hypothetical protein